MKNQRAQEVAEITYTVVEIFEGKAYTTYLGFKELFFYGQSEEREIVFCLSEEFETLIKMEVGQQMPIRTVRDADEWGIIERIK